MCRIRNFEKYILTKVSKKLKVCADGFHLKGEERVLLKLGRWESLAKRATTHWRTRRKHRVSSEWINNRMALVRSKYCQNTLPLPFDPLRLIFLSHRGSFVLINIVSLRVSLAKRRACEYANCSTKKSKNGVASQFRVF